eukprot:m.93302 g.93302  ORF g.93302 m.93302 type:complete len:719 (+) comp13397_c0_seq3:188-2344(+)
MMSKAKLELTQEQLNIVNHALSPSSIPAKGSVCVITSAAGTGKTTTMKHLADKLGELGHKQVAYLIFNKAAQLEAAKSFNYFGTTRCRTFHAVARELKIQYKELGHERLDDTGIERFIRNNFSDVIEDKILSDVPQPKRKVWLIKRITYLVRKTLERFLHSDKSMGYFDLNPEEFTCYEAKKFHENSRVPGLRCTPGKAYGEIAFRVYEEITSKQKFWGHDINMKEIQIDNLLLNSSTAILVDEAQDMSECQASWVLRHKEGRQIFFVGDSAQSIYKFRGAKSSTLSKLARNSENHHFQLTKSFRFGDEIAAIANTILFVKENTPQDWTPYRVVGGGKTAGTLAVASQNADRTPRTIVAFKHVTLFQTAIMLLEAFPDIRISVSCCEQWRTGFRKIKQFYEMMCGRLKSYNGINGFGKEDGVPNWKYFIEQCEERELNGHLRIVAFVETYKESSVQKAKDIENKVLKQKYSEDEAEIVLTTIHAFKGKEADTIEVCDDISDLAVFKKLYDIDPLKAAIAEFDFKWGSEDLNLWYVAVTRPKKKLILPSNFMYFLKTMKFLYKEQSKCNVNLLDIKGKPVLFSPDEVFNLKSFVVLPWIHEFFKHTKRDEDEPPIKGTVSELWHYLPGEDGGGGEASCDEIESDCEPTCDTYLDGEDEDEEVQDPGTVLDGPDDIHASGLRVVSIVQIIPNKKRKLAEDLPSKQLILTNGTYVQVPNRT